VVGTDPHAVRPGEARDTRRDEPADDREDPAVTSTATDARTLIESLLADMAGGDLAAFERTCHPTATNRSAAAEPPACRTPGPEGFYATALWLRGMFSDLRWDVHEAVAQDDLLVAHVTMHGRHTGPLTRYSADGDLLVDVPATGRTFAVGQSHWYRIVDDLIVEHWLNHDSMELRGQLGLLG
jgi:predicted ester cyclase